MEYVWNRYGEIIGKTSGKSYTDYSDKATATYGGGAQASKIWDSGSSSVSSSKSTSSGEGTSSLIGMIVPPSSSSSSRSSGGSTYTAPSQPAPSKADALITALKNIGSQWSSASPQSQAELNRQASQLRSEYVQAGGNIADIPNSFWGSDPNKGFQTGSESFVGGSIAGGIVPASGLASNAGSSQPATSIEGFAKAGMIVPGKGVDSSSLPEPEYTPFMKYGFDLTPEIQKEMASMGITTDEAMKVFMNDFNKETGFDYDAIGLRLRDLAEQKLMREPQIVPIEEQIVPYITELKNIASQVNYETAPVITKYYDQIMDMISITEASIMKKFEEMGKGIDPATQAALASLKETVNRQREYLKEEMSARNLLQSGIYLRELDERINRGELTETQKLLSQRLSDIQNQINSALMNFANMRVSAANQYGTEAIKAAENAAQRKQEAIQNLTNAWMKAVEEANRQKAEAQKLAWEKEKFYAPWIKGPTSAEMLPYQYVKADTAYTHGAPSGNALLQHAEWETEWPYKQAKYEYDINKPYYKPESGGTAKSQKLAAIQQGAVNLVNQLMTTGKRTYMGSSGDVGASGGEQWTYSGSLPPEQAAQEAIKTVHGQLGDLQLSSSELKDVEDLIYRAAGVSKEPADYQKLFMNEYWKQKYKAGDYSRLPGSLYSLW